MTEERNRKGNWSHLEIMTLLEGLIENKHVILSSLSPEITAKKKTEAWQSIAVIVSNVSDVGAVGFNGRTIKELREKFNGLKKKISKEGDTTQPDWTRRSAKKSIRQRDDCEIFTNAEKLSSTTTPMCLGTGNAPYTDIVYPAPVPPSADVRFEFGESSFSSLPMPVHQKHPPPVPSTEGSSIHTFAIPDHPLNADGVQLQVTIDHGEEREGPVTEGMQTMGSLASPAPPLHSSSMKKRRAENKRMGINKRARQLDYNAENTVITEYYKILIEKEKRALEREAEKHKLEKEALEREAEKHKLEKEALEREAEKHKLEKEALERAVEKHKLEKEALERAAERDREATKFFATGTAVAELLKQKLETELKQ